MATWFIFIILERIITFGEVLPSLFKEETIENKIWFKPNAHAIQGLVLINTHLGKVTLCSANLSLHTLNNLSDS